jgi:hypothetical protein
MRVPARLWMVGVVCLSACAAIAVAGIESPRARRAIVAGAVVALLLDGWPRALVMFDVPAMRVTKVHASARLGLPIRENETETMYGAIAQERPVFNGYSGYSAPQHAALVDMLEAHDTRILQRIAATQRIEVIVESATDADRRWRAWLDASPIATRQDAGDGWTSYEINPTGFTAPPVARGTQLRIARVTASTNPADIGAVLDADVDSRWHAVRQEGIEEVTMDLGAPQSVRVVVMCLGAYPSQYPRALDVDVSRDGASWTTVRTGGTVLETYDAALQSPREVPVTIPIDRADVRFIRLRQTKEDPHGWSIVELRAIQ